MNTELFKRYSTYANALSMVVAAVLVSVPNLGLDSTMTAQIMLAGNVVVAVCQVIKQNYNT